MPRNPLIAEPLFRVKYVEKAGTGTTDMISDCLDAGLPEPTFRQSGPHFVTTIWRDGLTDEILAGLELSDRQIKAVKLVKQEGRITNKMYRDALNVIDRTALRDLKHLVKLEILERIGETGQNTYYVIKIPTRHEPDTEGYENPT